MLSPEEGIVKNMNQSGFSTWEVAMVQMEDEQGVD